MPSNLSAQVKDLIGKMLVVNPAFRIHLQQIKAHPWFNYDNPIDIYFKTIPKQFQRNKLNQQVFRQLCLIRKLKKMNISFHNYGQDKIKKAIKKREDVSFVIAYQLLLNQHLNKLKANKKKNTKSLLFSKIVQKNSQKNSFIVQQPQCYWKQGREYNKHPKQIMLAIYQILTASNVQITMKCSSISLAKQYRIKCLYKNPNKLIPRINSCFSLMGSDGQDEIVQIQIQKNNQDKIPRYSKKFIKFSIQIYKVKVYYQFKKNHLVDVQLNRGHPIIFLDFLNSFFSQLEKSFA